MWKVAILTAAVALLMSGCLVSFEDWPVAEESAAGADGGSGAAGGTGGSGTGGTASDGAACEATCADICSAAYWTVSSCSSGACTCTAGGPNEGCDPATGDGCPSGMRCSTPTHCGPPGTALCGEPCASTLGECAAGLACAGRCVRWCYAPAPPANCTCQGDPWGTCSEDAEPDGGGCS